MERVPLRLAIVEATRVLAEAGVASPGVDAELLAAHVLDTPRGRLGLTPLVDPATAERFRALVARRADRIPLQHIVGSAAFGPIEVLVGPGVFTPRPETEHLLEYALRVLDSRPRPVVLDLCTGSGALALAVAAERPDAVVHAVERDPAALAWARRNVDRRADLGDTPVRLHHGDVTDRALLPSLDGAVDLVLANPPYVPDDAELEPEVREHDPHAALFGGPDGLAVIEPMLGSIARWVRVGGHLAIEHDDSHADGLVALVRRRSVFGDVVAHRDLAGRPRYVSATRVTRAAR